jgi:hypothetical protein
LDEYGPIDTPERAQAALDAALTRLPARGGGVLFIPAAAPAGWTPSNVTQEQLRTPAPPAPARNWSAGPGVTVVDLRCGTLQVLPPQNTGLALQRVMDLPRGQSLPSWEWCPLVHIESELLRGGAGPVVTIQAQTDAHNENQTFDLCLWRHNFMLGPQYPRFRFGCRAAALCSSLLYLVLGTATFSYSHV